MAHCIGFNKKSVRKTYHADALGDGRLETLRAHEYSQLKDTIYLDHAGTTLYARSLVENFANDMVSNLYGNPHSDSKPSAKAGQAVDDVRAQALKFFRADPEHWDLVFTANATAAIKLVVECFRDKAVSTDMRFWYGYHADAHTSIVGGRELSASSLCFRSDADVEDWLRAEESDKPAADCLGLFAYPGQSNMTGRRLPLDWCGRLRKRRSGAKVYTLLDAAALASTNQIDLSEPSSAPDLVALSFYKIFGFPNLGALLVRKDSAAVLKARKYFGGGTIDAVTTGGLDWHASKVTNLHDRLEDGTLPFHSIFALGHAISVHKRLYGPEPMLCISMHTSRLIAILFQGLIALRHANGQPLVVVYNGQDVVYGDPKVQGATVAFNIHEANGAFIGYKKVETAANAKKIHLRSGSLCNPGGIVTYLGWSDEGIRAGYAAGHRCSKPIEVVNGRQTGVVRASLGAMSSASDVVALLKSLHDTYLQASKLSLSEK
ncbi:Molybdenum cofactor sulfurase [Elsinoe australis]|uniref:Molybdenum cofactor sulfurase n=1 Tax=Elsinoe australis TaxID=40998 RepID=A0A2P8AIM4_9PEZI|nr:Molybdenum cofactor sulfurase [Elsinoe australis]